MPLLVDENGVIARITFDRQVAEPPLREGVFRKAVTTLWFLILGK